MTTQVDALLFITFLLLFAVAGIPAIRYLWRGE